MSMDFSPRDCWLVNEELDGLYISNIKFKVGDIEEWMYTDEELSDRKAHQYLAVLGSDIYTTIRQMLSNPQFERLNNTLGDLIDADFNHGDTSVFPKEMTDWYFNRHNCHYHEPNDEAFVEFVRGAYTI